MSIVLGLLLGLLGCQTDKYPVPIAGTTYRIDEDKPDPKSDVVLDLLTSWSDCAEAKVVDMEACLPRADRSSGELHFSFRLRDPVSLIELSRSLEQDQILIVHDGREQAEIELIPHEPVGTGQLYVIVLDGSGSMFENGGERIRKVYSALLAPSVIKNFYPEGNSKTGVVLLRFTDKVVGLDGGPPRVLDSAEEYRTMVERHLLTSSGGYTHMYSAVKYAVTDLMDSNVIRTFTTISGAEPSVIVISDGFNNEKATDLCKDNVPRLQETVDVIRNVRTSTGNVLRPTVYGVGFGRPFIKMSKPKGLSVPITPDNLCDRYAEERIDGRLETIGIDHISLQWIAEAGGGRSFVKDKAKELAEVLATAAATRYRWYEVWYRVPDGFYHRKSFDIQLQLQGSVRAASTVRVHPHGWLDAPTATRDPNLRWHTPTPFRHTFTVLMPALGTLVLLVYIGPAVFNTRRALFRRARPRQGK
jgi:hypothetical protein